MTESSQNDNDDVIGKMAALIDIVGRAIAEADHENYMEDYLGYDKRARAAISAIRKAGYLSLTKK